MILHYSHMSNSARDEPVPEVPKNSARKDVRGDIDIAFKDAVDG